jgi:hypothetical protein
LAPAWAPTLEDCDENLVAGIDDLRGLDRVPFKGRSKTCVPTSTRWAAAWGDFLRGVSV